MNSTSPSGGNLVDGLSPARHTGAVAGRQGMFGPAPIGTQDPLRFKFEDQND